MFHTYHRLEGSNHTQPRVAAVLSCGTNLMAASWHMPISRSPFRYAVAIRAENHTHALLSEHQSFALNFLPFACREAIETTGRHHGNLTDKLSLTGLQGSSRDLGGNVLLDASDFIYSCEVVDTYENGDHTMFIADVHTIHVSPSPSLQPALFLGKGRYATMTPPAPCDTLPEQRR